MCTERILYIEHFHFLVNSLPFKILTNGENSNSNLDWLITLSIGLMSRVFTNGPGNRGSIPGRVMQKILKWYLMPPCLIHHYKMRIKGKVKQSREWGNTLLYTSV